MIYKPNDEKVLDALELVTSKWTPKYPGSIMNLRFGYSLGLPYNNNPRLSLKIGYQY